MCVKNAMDRSRVNQIDFKDDSTLTADFQHVLNMDSCSMSLLKKWISSELDTTIKRGDGSYIKCIQDLAKYVLYLQSAKEAAALPPFNPKLSSTFKPMCRRKPSYKKCLNQVIEIATLYLGKQAKVTPTADFEDDLGMSKDDVFVFIYHLSKVIENCSVDWNDAIYTLRLRCCQDVADVVCDPNSFLLPYEEQVLWFLTALGIEYKDFSALIFQRKPLPAYVEVVSEAENNEAFLNNLQHLSGPGMLARNFFGRSAAARGDSSWRVGQTRGACAPPSRAGRAGSSDGRGRSDGRGWSSGCSGGSSSGSSRPFCDYCNKRDIMLRLVSGFFRISVMDTANLATISDLSTDGAFLCLFGLVCGLWCYQSSSFYS